MIQPDPPTAGQTYKHRNKAVYIPDGYLAVGKVIGIHGLKGEVKVEIHTDFPERFAQGVTLFLGDELQPCEIQQARLHKGHVLLQISGVKHRNEAELLRGQWLFVNEENAVPLEEGRYWVHDIVGLKVQTDEERYLGTIRDVLFTGANEVYIVQTEEDVNQGKDILLPAIADVVQSVDIDAGLMVVSLLPGLIEE